MSNRLFYEDLLVGERFYSSGRTITEADVVNFAGLSGDYNALHMDAEYAKTTQFGERIAHGLLGLVVASGLFTKTELNSRLHESLIALLGVDWKFTGPLYIGDTIHLEIEVISKRNTKKPDRGIVVLLRKVINQHGEVVQKGEIPMLLKTKDAE
ncbi:MaoC/PaaZ C-terminal domain-containing protein [Oceanobacillus longus]|uniref:MaoC/PaaZ C-terminal domain-containing protein n=1 Tax=Oceanobacillus longus TaxID=930120 RepID=A0ABV8H045_9BACI